MICGQAFGTSLNPGLNSCSRYHGNNLPNKISGSFQTRGIIRWCISIPAYGSSSLHADRTGSVSFFNNSNPLCRTFCKLFSLILVGFNRPYIQDQSILRRKFSSCHQISIPFQPWFSDQGIVDLVMDACWIDDQMQHFHSQQNGRIDALQLSVGFSLLDILCISIATKPARVLLNVPIHS